ncbi:hypothetical protein [Paenibacillus sp. 4624]|uniref:hypothetical protein n=1 Tax=Paenibacillus sp. 4624 TaxID=3156453 RepID=UPI003D1C06A5
MNYPVVKTFRDRTSLKRHVIGGTYETDDQNRAEHLQKEGFIGSEIKQEKPKTSRGGKGSSGKGKSDDPGGEVNESSKAEPEDTPAKEE